ncbi:hypothetical protein PU02_0809 [Bartonella ancashensis]|uniref:Uncharacterized protein n=1 Tax=Bartonella ancashensis TaxID=1318743 RepID=A0A0M5L131_9HYPH|nr:hypothetical protein PU02_0809 [Bartonella ancashensis]
MISHVVNFLDYKKIESFQRDKKNFPLRINKLTEKFLRQACDSDSLAETLDC